VKVVALAAIAAGVFAVSIRWGTFVAGGSDSYCYVDQAQRWAAALTLDDALQVPEPLVFDAPWPDAALTFAPVGHAPSATVAGANVPVCPSGLSLAMAPFVMIGGRGAAFAVVPLLGALLVLATFAAGTRFGTRVGIAAAALIACSPVLLYQVVQPMSDVPAAASWMVAVAAATGTSRRQALWSGLATSAAILMRPNLVPMGIPIGLFLLFRPERTWRRRVRDALTYASASIPGCLAVAAVQTAFFGSPLSSGYGAFDNLFGTEHVWPNLQRYLPWLLETHTPLVVVALLAPVLLPGALSGLFIALFAVNLALYLPYIEFEHWSFLRFLLPSLPLVLILVAACVDAIGGRLLFAVRGAATPAPARRWGRIRDVTLAVTVLALGFACVREARDRQAFRLQTLESRFERAGLYVRDRLPANAFVVTSWHSGSVRFYGGRKTLVWTALDPAWFERALMFVENRGYEPYLLFERWEEPQFRSRFKGTSIGALDWPPAAEIGAQVRIYRPGDRERYLTGDVPPTDYAK
jgi:hypothetical protein